MNRMLRPVPVILLLLATSRCGFLEDDPRLEEFTFDESTHGVTIEPGIDAASLGDGIAFVGQLNTPSPCYRLIGEFDDSGSQLTLRVIGRRTTTTCEQIVGNFRYQGAIRNLKVGTYQLRIRHSFENSTWEPQEFNTSVTVR